MAGSIESHDAETRDVAINVVPFIDLMSCLTAFLLVTAVWASYAQIPVEHGGVGQDGVPGEELTPMASLLISAGEVRLGLSSGERYTFPPTDDGRHDWRALEQQLTQLKHRSDLEGVQLEIAAEDTILYRELVTAMDLAVETGFGRMTVVDPASLEVALKE
jgi:biopolymer transport protein ExbD